MSTANWGDLWDQAEQIAFHTQKGIDYLEKYGGFLKERAAIEEEYAAKLRALAKKNLPKKKEEDEHPFSYARSFHGVLHEMESLAGQHEVVAEQFKRELVPVALGVCTDLKAQRKSHLTDLQQLHQRLNGAIENMFKCQKNYGKMFKEAEAASLKYDKAEKNMDLSRAELERAKHNAHQRSQQCDEAKQTYAHSLQATNDLQHQHYTIDLPSVLEKLRIMDETRVGQTKKVMEASIKVEMDLTHIIQRCYEDMLKSAAKIDPQGDSMVVVQRFRSGYAHPTPYPFEDLGSPSAILNGGAETSSQNGQPLANGGAGATLRRPRPGGSSKLQKKHSMHQRIFGHKNDSQEDYSDLPPQQRCRKLEGKIERIEREISTRTQSRDGLLKMQTVYRENPKLGNVDQVDEQLVTVSRELDALTTEVQKFKNYLLEAQSQLNTPITEAFATPSPQSARPTTKPPSQNGNGAATSPNGSLASSSASSKTRSLPPGAKAPTSGSPQRRLATPPTTGVQRSSYSEDSISSDGSAFSNHGGSVTRLQQHQHKSPNRSGGLRPSAHGSSVSPESGYGADDGATSNGRLYDPAGSEGREVYNECDPLPALGTCTAVYAFDGGSEGTTRMSEGEELLLIERDEGDGWTRVRKLHSSDEGFVPTSYLNCKWYPE